MRTRANVGPERECKKPRWSREEWGESSWISNFAPGFAARENSLAVEAREGISGFAAKSLARAPTPASYAGYRDCLRRSNIAGARRQFSRENLACIDD